MHGSTRSGALRKVWLFPWSPAGSFDAFCTTCGDGVFASTSYVQLLLILEDYPNSSPPFFITRSSLEV